MRRLLYGSIMSLLLLTLVFLIFASKTDYGKEQSPSLEAQDQDRYDLKEAELETEESMGRQQWYYQQRAFPIGTIPRGARERAMKYVKEQMRPLRSAKINANLAGLSWRSVGPDSIPNGQVFPNGQSAPVSGRVTALAIDRNNSNIIYLGAAQGGVWKTTDGGSSWTPLTDDQATLAVGSMVMDPTNSSILYVGTGEGNGALDSYFGAGVLKTTNGGATWSRQAATTFRGVSIADMVINPTTPSVLYAAVTRGFAGVNGISDPAAQQTGVYKGEGGGIIWTRLANAPSGNIQDLEIDPTNPNIIYATDNGKDNSGSSGIFRTTDGGTTWNQLGTTGFPTQFGRIAIAVAPTNTQVIYASVENFNNSELRDIFRSTDGGATWAAIARPQASGFGNICQCFYDNVIAVSPTSSNRLFFGAVNFQRYTRTIFSEIWEDLSQSGLMHPDFHAIVFDPSNSDRMIVGNDGGIWLSSDGGDTWSNINGNLAITQFEYIAIHPTDATFVMGGTQDNGTLIRTTTPIFVPESKTWTHSQDGDGGAVLVDFNNPSTLYHTFPRVSFERSDNGGSTWLTKRTGLNTNDRTLFYSPIAMDPSNSSTLYFGTFRLNRSTNRGDNWAAISGDLTNGGAISAIAVAPNSSQTIYVGTSDGNIQVSTNGGTTFNLRVTGLPARYVTRIAVDPTNSQHAYASLSGFGSGHVFETTNSGTNWTNISGNLPDIPVNALVIDSSAANRLFIGTDIGVFVTSDGGVTWFELSTGLPNSAVFDLKLNNTTQSLFAATHGRGVFKLNQNGSPPSISGFSPLAVLPFQTLTINGSNLLSVESVAINGTRVSFTANSVGTQITVFLPLGITSGPITVRNANGTGTSADHLYVGAPGSAPAISSFSPTRGPRGSLVTIHGTNFSALGTQVRFNGVNAGLVTFLSNNRIQVTVPSGATSGPITVTTANGTATSSSNFTVN
ncbi:MAG: IPT/TIG domain-containing protein [Acidobacteriota bacterium]